VRREAIRIHGTNAIQASGQSRIGGWINHINRAPTAASFQVAQRGLSIPVDAQ
jgi:hypothetical protein